MYLKKHRGDRYNSFIEELDTLNEEGFFFTDTHTHLQFKQLVSNIEDIIKKAEENAVKRFLAVGINKQDSTLAVDLANNYKNIYVSVGVHPQEAKYLQISDMKSFEEMLKNKKVLAIGEIGLDLYREDTALDKQEKVFLQFLDLAEKYNKPVIVHNRDASERCMQIMEASLSHRAHRENNGILHCFNGDRSMIKWALDRGFYMSFAGNITYPNAVDLQECIKYIPNDRLLIETDAPYLAPMPFRGRINEPAYVVFTAYTISMLKDICLAELSNILEENFQKLFNIK